MPEKKDQAIGRSKGGLSTKIHARTDAFGNPTGFYLTAGPAHDLNGADMLLDLSLSQTWLMDKAYNSKDRVIDPIQKVKGQVVMPSKSNAIDQRNYDQHLYKARHLIENFFAKPSSIEVLPHAMINWLKTSYQRSILPQQSFGLIDDTP